MTTATSEIITSVDGRSAGADAPARRTLSRQRILDAAADIVQVGGPSTLSMRKLADRLGVTPMALYRWFDDKDDLLSALIDRIAEPTASIELPEGPWVERALAYAVAIRRNLLDHLPVLQIEGASRRLAVLGHQVGDGIRLMGGRPPRAAWRRSVL